MNSSAANAHPRTRRPGPRRAAQAAAMMAFAFTAATSADAVRIAGVDYLGDLPTRVADHNNLFVAEGVDAVVSYSASGRDNLRALRAGETDFALMALTPLAIDLVLDRAPRGTDDPVILASVVHSTRLNHVVALGNGAPRNPAVAAYAGEADLASRNLQKNRDAILYGLNLDWSLLASMRQQVEWALHAGYGGEAPSRDVLARVDARPLRAIVPSAIGIPYTDRGSGPVEWQP